MHIRSNKALDKLTRRRFLKGAGGAAVALPLLHGAEGVTAQEAGIPERFIALFVANGLHNSLTDGGANSGAAMFNHAKHGFAPLEGFKPFADRICLVKGIDAKARGFSSTPHTWGCGGFLCDYNYSNKNANTKAGTTIDWEFKTAKNIDTTLPTLNTGWWGADDANQPVRIVHSYRGPNQPNNPIALPHNVFDFAFNKTGFAAGAGGGNMVNAQELRRARFRNSVLDAVMEDYQHVMSESSGYGAAVRETIKVHLDHVRELEKSSADLVARIERGEIGNDPDVCAIADEPRVINNNKANGSFPPNLSFRSEVWDLNAKIFISALHCDLFRTGTFMVDSGGDKWAYEGKNGRTGNVHGTTLHGWKKNNHQPLAYEIMHWYWTKMASDFVARLNNNTYVEAGGGTLLDNTTLIIGSELNDPDHNVNNMTFFLMDPKKFKPGKHTLANRRSASDFYTTVLKGCGINKQIGSHFQGTIDSILV